VCGLANFACRRCVGTPSIVVPANAGTIPRDYLFCAGLVASHQPAPVVMGPCVRRDDKESVPEMPDTGEHHGDAVVVGGLDHLIVADRAAGLNHSRSAASMQASMPSANGKNASEATTEPFCERFGELQFGRRILRLARGDAAEIDPAHMAGADATVARSLA